MFATDVAMAVSGGEVVAILAVVCSHNKGRSKFRDMVDIAATEGTLAFLSKVPHGISMGRSAIRSWQ